MKAEGENLAHTRRMRLGAHLAMAEHSICHPGRPLPHGDSQNGSPALDFFHSAKSLALRFSPESRPALSAPSPSSASAALPTAHGASLA